MTTPRIVVVGSVNVDMVVKGPRLPAPGETVVGGRFVMAGGGKGANQAVAAARLGARVALIAKVGRDIFGDQAIESFRRDGIDTAGVLRDPDQATGVALILVDSGGENLISVASGANYALTPEDISQAADRIAAADVLMLQLETPVDTVCRAAEIAAAAGVRVILNPAPAADLPDGLWPHVSCLTPNESEAERLTGLPVGDEAGARRAAEKLLAMGVGAVVVTLGARGALLVDGRGVSLVPSRAVEAVDATAAGDAFNGGLAWALASGMDLPAAVRQACLVGALSATRLGAQPSLPTYEEFVRFASAT
jgi:ribokinase